ncbi:MAG: DUF6064 family protein [Anaerolineae bacterium]
MVTFTLQEFLDMIASYNDTYWPLPVVGYALGILAVILAMAKTAGASRVASAVLVIFWLWVGIVFNGLVFTELSSTSIVFAVLFVIQGILLAATGVLRTALSYRPKADVYGIVGGLALLYGLAGYPAIEHLLGRGYPQTLVLGLVPCPTVVFTLGLFLWSARPLPKALLAIPVLYALAGGLLAASQGIVEDIGMISFGLVAAVMILVRDRTGQEPALKRPGRA